MNSPFLSNEQYSCLESCYVHRYSLNFCLNAFHESLFECFQVAQPNSVRGAVAKRQSEFLAGRVAATRLLHKLGVRQQIAIGQHRAPIWPEGMLGSISHSGNRAVCCISDKKDNDYLGVDIEEWVDEATAESIKGSILDKAEEEYLECVSLPFSQSLTLIFSAKESLFKALYPKVEAYFGFEAARLVKIDLVTQSFVLTLTGDLPGGYYVKGDEFTGSFRTDRGSVETLLVGKHSTLNVA